MTEKGINLSGGQKQFIGILCTFCKNLGIVLLDKCTSALDPQTEKLVLDSLRDYCNSGKTIIFVTHRISIMKSADKIAFIKEKKIFEEGKYDDLVQKEDGFLM